MGARKNAPQQSAGQTEETTQDGDQNTESSADQTEQVAEFVASEISSAKGVIATLEAIMKTADVRTQGELNKAVVLLGETSHRLEQIVQNIEGEALDVLKKIKILL